MIRIKTTSLATGFHLLIRVNHLEDVMARLKSLTIVAVLLVSGISLAMAQNGLPTGGEPPVAGGAAGNPILDYGHYRGAHHRHIYNYYRPYHRHWHY